MPRLARLLAFLPLAAVALAGCLGGGDEGGSDAPPGTGGSDPGDLPAPPANATGSLPAWEVGQWWSWRLESQAMESSLTATTAVLSSDAAGYQVGSPDPEEAGEVYPFHLVPLGAVDRATLSWEAHGRPVEILRFPLEDGATWTTDIWATDDADILVRSAQVPGPDGPEPGFRVNVTYPGQPEALVLSAYWSPVREQFVRVETYFGQPSPFAAAVLVSQGTNFTEPVQPFEATELVRWTASPADPPGLAPRTFTVEDGMDLVVFACFLGGGQGEFRATMALPDATSYTCEALATDAGRAYAVWAVPSAAGSGEVAAAPLGQGSAVIEVFGVRTQA